jgi:hypothetical protein
MRMKKLGNTGLLVSAQLSAEELETPAKVSALPPEYPGWMLAFQGRDRGEALE